MVSPGHELDERRDGQDAAVWLELDFGRRRPFARSSCTRATDTRSKTFKSSVGTAGNGSTRAIVSRGNTEVSPHDRVLARDGLETPGDVLQRAGSSADLWHGSTRSRCTRRCPLPVARVQTAAVESRGGQLDVQVWQPGKYELKAADGTTRRFEVASMQEPLEIAGPWQLRFPSQVGGRRKR